LLSSSYAPDATNPRFEEMIDELRRLFAANEQNGKVEFDYQTEVYYGRMRSVPSA